MVAVGLLLFMHVVVFARGPLQPHSEELAFFVYSRPHQSCYCRVAPDCYTECTVSSNVFRTSCGPACLSRPIFNSKTGLISRTIASNLSASCSFAARSQSSSQNSLVSALRLCLQTRNRSGSELGNIISVSRWDLTPREVPFRLKRLRMSWRPAGVQRQPFPCRSN